MPTVRQRLLRAAGAALADRPWPRVRMGEVAAAAGVSRQTLYNEFGSKEGIGAALVTAELDAFLDRVAYAVARSARGGADPVAGCAAAAAKVVRAARREPLVRAALTGCWGSRLPRPGVPPDRLAARLCGRTVAALASHRATAPCAPGVPDPALRRACETGLRLALSYVVAPCPGTPKDTGADGIPEAAGATRTIEDVVSAHVAQVVRALLG